MRLGWRLYEWVDEIDRALSRAIDSERPEVIAIEAVSDPKPFFVALVLPMLKLLPEFFSKLRE